MQADEEDPKPGEPVTYEETREEQEVFEALLREHHGDFQAAVDAQRRGEKPKHVGNAEEGW